MRLSVVLPVFNETENINPLYARLTATLERIACDAEIIFVDDGSTDESLRTIERLAENDSRVKFLSLSRNFGHEIASTAGLDHADGDAVVLMDADLQDPPELIESMLDRWLHGFDVVYATRLRRNGESMWKRIGPYLFYRAMRVCAAVDLPLDTGDFRLMDRRVVEAFRKFPESGRFVRGIVSWMGFRQTAIEFERPARHAGVGKYGVTKLLRFGLDGLLSFSIAPLRFATLIGFVCVLAALGGCSASLLRNFFPESSLPAFSLAPLGVLLLGGTQLLAIGVLGEYVGRTHREVMRRPLYLVDKSRGWDRKARRLDRRLDSRPQPQAIDDDDSLPARQEAA